MSDRIPRRIELISPTDGGFLAYDAIRVYSAAGCVIRITPFAATNITDTVDLTFAAGHATEPVGVKRVWSSALTGSPIIHGYKY